MRVVKHLCSSDFETAVASMMRVELVLLAVFLQVNHSVKYFKRRSYFLVLITGLLIFRYRIYFSFFISFFFCAIRELAE